MTHDAPANDSPTPGSHRRFVDDPGRIETLVEDMRAGRLSSEALVTRFLDTLYRSLTAARLRLYESLADAHAVLWPAAPDTAPRGLAWTGDPRYIAPWTALGGPVVSVNVGTDGNGLPFGALLIGAPGTDMGFTGVARRLAEAVEV